MTKSQFDITLDGYWIWLTGYLYRYRKSFRTRDICPETGYLSRYQISVWRLDICPDTGYLSGGRVSAAIPYYTEARKPSATGKCSETIDYFDGTGGKVPGLVVQSVMSATDTLGHWDVRGLTSIDFCLRQWISVRTMPKDVGMPLYSVLVTDPHLFVRGDNTIPISNEGIARLCPMVWSQVQFPVWGGLKAYRLCSVGYTWLWRGYQAGLTPSIEGLATLN